MSGTALFDFAGAKKTEPTGIGSGHNVSGETA